MSCVLIHVLQKADDLDLDVVMISPDADPPVVRLVDFSKFKFEAAKAAKEASKKQRETRRVLRPPFASCLFWHTAQRHTLSLSDTPAPMTATESCAG